MCSLHAMLSAIVFSVVKLFNVIQQSQVAAASAAENLKNERGTGKPTLPAPQLDRKKKKGKHKDNILGQGGKEGTFLSICFFPGTVLIHMKASKMLGQSDFLESIRSGGVVSKV